MPLTDRPLYREVFGPTLKAIQDLGGSATRAEVKAEVARHYSDDEQAEMMPNGRASRLHFYTGWALTRLRYAGAIENSQQGVWALTERGRAATDNELDELWERMLAAARAARQQRGLAEPVETATDEDAFSDSSDGDGWKDSLVTRMKAMEPAAFERLIQRLLREANFEKVEVTGRSGDGGIDGVGLIKLGLLSFPTYFQCKRYDNSIGAGAVRDFRGAMAGRGEKGVLIATATFTAAAQQEATRDGVTPIDLVDGDELCELLRKHRVGVNVEIRTVEDVSVDVGFWDSFT